MTPIFLSHDGRTMTLPEWARRLGLTPAGLSYRLKQGWPLHRALSLPPLAPTELCTFSAQRVLHDGEYLTFSEWSARTGIAPATIYKRLQNGMTPAEAITKPVRSYPARGRGRASNFAPSKGTGAGSAQQELPNLEISQ